LDLQAELDLAVEAAHRAGVIQMERYERLERIVHKSEHDVVTEVDKLTEDLILAAVREAFPTDSILAEESGSATHDPGTPAPEPGTERLWVVDPLDGTVNYANGIPLFCVSIALAIGGRPVMGVVHDPARNETFTARLGHGAQLDGVPIHHPTKARLVDCVISMGVPRSGYARRAARIRAGVRASRNIGTGALGIAYVANGRFDAFVQVPGGLSAWDVAAAGIIAEEGGAIVTSGDGGPWFDLGRPSHRSGIVAAAPAHHATLLEMLR
jgi:myo-inositol-1(or 4)-monophosphatase